MVILSREKKNTEIAIDRENFEKLRFVAGNDKCRSLSRKTQYPAIPHHRDKYLPL